MHSFAKNLVSAGTRRQFLIEAGLFSAIAMNAADSAGTPALATAEWVKLPRILIAEGFTPPFYPSLEYDPAKALAIARSLNADALRFPAAAYYSYVPTRTEYPVHPELRGADPLASTIDLFHRAGLRVLTYVPLFHPFMEADSKAPVYQQWVRRYADGQPMTTDHYGYGLRFESCGNSPLRWVMLEFVRELLERYPVDVMYFDGPYAGISTWDRVCYCRYCQQAFQQARGQALPPDDRHLTRQQQIEYFTWVSHDSCSGFLGQMRETIRGVRDVPVFYNNGALLERRDPSALAYPRVDGFMFEHAETPEQKLFNIGLGKSTGKTVWTYVGSYQQYNREHLRNQDCQGWFSYPVETEELLMDGRTALVAGAGPLYWGLARFFYMPKDPLSYESGRHVREIFDFVQTHEALLRALKPQSQAAVVVGKQTLDWFGGADWDSGSYRNYFYGAASVLRDNGCQAQPILDHEISEAKLAPFRLVWLANAACLSDAQCEALAAYVRNGGTLVATHLTSIADEFGRMRPDFGLSALFGASAVSAETVEIPDLYLTTADGREVPQDPQIVRFKAAQGSTILADTIQRGRHGKIGPAVVERRDGKGRIIYIGSGLDAIYEETRMAPVRDFIGRLIAPSLDSTRTFEVPMQLGLIPWFAASRETLVLHVLANTGNKERKFRTRESFLPLEIGTVRLRIPDGRSVRRVSSMKSGREHRSTVEGGWVTVEMPPVLIWDALRVDLT